jgi:hypothetical protein
MYVDHCRLLTAGCSAARRAAAVSCSVLQQLLSQDDDDSTSSSSASTDQVRHTLTLLSDISDVYNVYIVE